MCKSCSTPGQVKVSSIQQAVWWRQHGWSLPPWHRQWGTFKFAQGVNEFGGNIDWLHKTHRKFLGAWSRNHTGHLGTRDTMLDLKVSRHSPGYPGVKAYLNALYVQAHKLPAHSTSQCLLATLVKTRPVIAYWWPRSNTSCRCVAYTASGKELTSWASRQREAWPPYLPKWVGWVRVNKCMLASRDAVVYSVGGVIL